MRFPRHRESLWQTCESIPLWLDKRDSLHGRGSTTQHLPPELFDCHAEAYRGGDAPPWRHAEPEGLMAVATRQEWQDDGDGDQDDDNPLQDLHTSGGGLIGHFFINTL